MVVWCGGKGVFCNIPIKFQCFSGPVTLTSTSSCIVPTPPPTQLPLCHTHTLGETRKLERGWSEKNNVLPSWLWDRALVVLPPGKQDVVMDKALGIFHKDNHKDSHPPPAGAAKVSFSDLYCENLVRFLEIKPMKMCFLNKTPTPRSFSLSFQSIFSLQQFVKIFI